MPELVDLMSFAAVLAVVGAGAGLLAGLLGVGGGIILVPAFFYGFRGLGYTSPDLMQIALATSLATIIVTSARSLQTHHRQGAVDWAILKGWGPLIAIGALFGVGVAQALSSVVLQAIFALLGVTIALYFAFGRTDWRLGEGLPGGAARAVTAPFIGLLSVLMGIGGGSLGVPLMSLYGVAIHRAVATASGFGLAIAVPSVAGFVIAGAPAAPPPPFMLGQVNLPAFALVVALTAVTAPVGARLAHRTAPQLLRRIFAGFILLVTLNMGVDALW